MTEIALNAELPLKTQAWRFIVTGGLAAIVDFGNPIAKVALECDGAQFHDARKDAARDRKLAALGWTVYRVPGWQCLRDVELPAGYDDMHDWGWLYVAPYGWVPMDVTFGRLDDGDPAIAGFYLGGLDAYRIAFNDDYGRELVPPKTHFRSETVDLQRGEVEWSGGNLYFDQWDYDFKWQILPTAQRHGG